MAGRGTYWLAVVVAVLVSLIQIWIRVVGHEEDPQNLGFFGVVVTAMACAFVARGRAAEMARAMLAVAGVQTYLALMLATAPVNAPVAQSILVFSSALVAGWLVSAALFWRSARGAA